MRKKPNSGKEAAAMAAEEATEVAAVASVRRTKTISRITEAAASIEEEAAAVVVTKAATTVDISSNKTNTITKISSSRITEAETVNTAAATREEEALEEEATTSKIMAVATADVAVEPAIIRVIRLLATAAETMEAVATSKSRALSLISKIAIAVAVEASEARTKTTSRITEAAAVVVVAVIEVASEEVAGETEVDVAAVVAGQELPVVAIPIQTQVVASPPPLKRITQDQRRRVCTTRWRRWLMRASSKITVQANSSSKHPLFKQRPFFPNNQHPLRKDTATVPSAGDPQRPLQQQEEAVLSAVERSLHSSQQVQCRIREESNYSVGVSSRYSKIQSLPQLTPLQ